MQRKKIIKKIAIIMLMLFIIFLEYKTFAIKASDLNPNDRGLGYLNNSIKYFGGSVLGTIRNIAAISSVILIAIFGLKFMFGSVDQKAEYKKYFMPLIVGMVVVVSGTSIASFIWDFGDEEHNIASCAHTLPTGVKCGTPEAICTKCGQHINSHYLVHKSFGVASGDYCEYCDFSDNVHHIGE